MTEDQIRKAYLDFQENNPIRHCSMEAQLLEFGKVCATKATEEFESCLEDTIKGKNPFPNLCWKLICDANDKLKEEIKNLKQNKKTVAYLSDCVSAIQDDKPTEAKKIINELLDAFSSNDFFDEDELNAMGKAEAFIKEQV